MANDKFFEELAGAVEGVRKLVGEVISQFTGEEPEAEPAEKPLKPTEGYLPKLGDVVRFRHFRTGQVERGRVTDIYDGPGNLAVRTLSDTFATVAWEKCELVDDLGFKPTPDYEPCLGDKVRVLDKKGFVHTGFVTQIHQNYKSAKVAIGTLESVTDQVTQAWKCLELIEGIKFGEEPREEPLEPVAKERLESELDDSLSEQVPHQDQPTEPPVVGAYGSVQAYEDLKDYYEEKLAQAQSDAQKVSQQHEAFKKAVFQELGLKGPTSERAVMNRIKQIRIYVLDDVKRATKKLQSAVDLWENP